MLLQIQLLFLLLLLLIILIMAIIITLVKINNKKEIGIQNNEKIKTLGVKENAGYFGILKVNTMKLSERKNKKSASQKN